MLKSLMASYNSAMISGVFLTACATSRKRLRAKSALPPPGEGFSSPVIYLHDLMMGMKRRAMSSHVSSHVQPCKCPGLIFAATNLIIRSSLSVTYRRSRQRASGLNSAQI